VQDAESTPSLTAINTLRDLLIKISDAGVGDAFPQSASGFSEELLEQLITQGESIGKRFKEFSDSMVQQMAKVNDVKTTPEQKFQLLTAIARGLLGADYVLLPKFKLTNIADVSQAFVHRAELLKHSRDVLKIPLPVDEWLHGASLVRKKIKNFELLRIINDITSPSALECQPIQIPYRLNDNWLAVEYPAGTEIVHDTVCVVQCLPQGFDATSFQTGLVIDDWTESIPKKEETTGISFHYNQPNSSPPQAVLLAVSPEEGTNWKWDHLVSVVLDTFERAKLRAVEPDMIDKVPGITTLLPAIVSEFSTGANNVSLDFSYNINEVFVQAQQLNKIM
jgi:hypothetical protein